MECAVDSVVRKLPQTVSMEIRWKIRSMLAKSKPSVSNATKKEVESYEMFED
jgi:hypothetical protein